LVFSGSSTAPLPRDLPTVCAVAQYLWVCCMHCTYILTDWSSPSVVTLPWDNNMLPRLDSRSKPEAYMHTTFIHTTFIHTRADRHSAQTRPTRHLVLPTSTPRARSAASDMACQVSGQMSISSVVTPRAVARHLLRLLGQALERPTVQHLRDKNKAVQLCCECRQLFCECRTSGRVLKR